MTHADRVRHKTDEELAALFTKIMTGNSGAQLDGIWPEKGMEENQRYFIRLNWLDWLKQEEITDLTVATVDKYHYELNILPQMIGEIKFTSND